MCGNPPEIENGFRTGPNIPSFGAVYEYGCDDGYVAMNDGYREITCMYTGEFSHAKDELIVCEKKGCNHV